MIINDSKKFIFIHIHKTAGSSIKKALLSIPGSKFVGYHHTHIKWINYKDYKDYYKFCFVRNPWDRLVSWYHGVINVPTNNDWQKYIKNKSKNFSEFLNCTDIVEETKYIDNGFLDIVNSSPYFKSISYNQVDYINDDNGNLLVDFIGRFENLENDWRKLLDNISLSFINLPKKNIGFHSNYKNYYTPEDIEKVRKLYERDIEYFKYEL